MALQYSFFTPAGDAVAVSSIGIIRKVSTSRFCVQETWKIPPEPPCDCDRSTVDAAALNGSVLGAKKIFDSMFCDSPWNLETSAYIDDRIAQLPANSREASDLYLLRFQKPGGFEPRKHLHILLAILRDRDYRQRHPDLVLGALQAVAVQSANLYQDLLKEMPELLDIRPLKTEACRTPHEETAVTQGVVAYMDRLKRSVVYENGSRSKSSFKQWLSLKPLSASLARLPQAQKDRAMDYTAQDLADKAADSREFHDVFLSKLYKFTENAVKPLFGDEQRPLTDVTIKRSANSVEPVILGSRPIDGRGGETDYGFFARSLGATPLKPGTPAGSSVLQREITWAQGSETYSGKIDIKVDEKADFIPRSDAPNYPELWADGKLTGVIITGTNLRDLSATVMDQYLEFYRQRGYAFEPGMKQISNLPSWLSDQVSSGATDYMIKEAHSDGDEKNLFRMDLKANVLVGRKKLQNGRVEEVHLVFPAKDTGDTRLMTNQDFGTLIRQREKAGKGEFVYFNTSCWSKTKAIHELEAAGSSKLVNIPSLTTVLTFTNGATNAERLMLESFLNGGKYEDIRAAMEKNDGYKKRQDNVLIFPDEEDYDRHIRGVIQTPLNIRLDIRDSQGQPYSLEAAGH